jgi:hypothetical protein
LIQKQYFETILPSAIRYRIGIGESIVLFAFLKHSRPVAGFGRQYRYRIIFSGKDADMGKQTNAYKQRWEAEHYRQVKVSVRRELAMAFKAVCEAAGVSVAGEISAFMSERCGQTEGRIGTPAGARCDRGTLSESDAEALSSKRKRRAAVKKILSQLETIKDAPGAALENTPENLRGSEAYENAEESLTLIEDAIDAVGVLAEIY